MDFSFEDVWIDHRSAIHVPRIGVMVVSCMRLRVNKIVEYKRLRVDFLISTDIAPNMILLETELRLEASIAPGVKASGVILLSPHE